MDYANVWSQSLAYDAFLAKYGSDEHRRRWAEMHRQITLDAATLELLRGFKRNIKMLCLAGAWCGDCVNQCPILDHFAHANPLIELRLFDRDDKPEWAGDLKVCGGGRVPVVVFLNEDDQFLGLYGDRTIAKYRQLAATQLGASCPTGLVAEDAALTREVIADWLRELERVQLIARLSPRLRERHND